MDHAKAPGEQLDLLGQVERDPLTGRTRAQIHADLMESRRKARLRWDETEGAYLREAHRKNSEHASSLPPPVDRFYTAPNGNRYPLLPGQRMEPFRRMEPWMDRARPLRLPVLYRRCMGCGRMEHVAAAWQRPDHHRWARPMTGSGPTVDLDLYDGPMPAHLRTADPY